MNKHPQPNTESIRRICAMSGGSYCFLLIDNNKSYLEVVSDIEQAEIHHCEEELKNWCGMGFKLLSPKEDKPNHAQIDRIRADGEMLWQS